MSKSTPKKPNTPTQIEWAPIESVTPYARNPRKIGADAISAVAGSIKEFGFKSPIIVDKDRVIINGHTRLKAAQQLGLKEVPIVVASDLTPEQVRAYRIADNRSSEFSKWDADLLNVELDDIGDIDLSFCNVDEMLAELAEQSQEEPQEQMTEGDPDAVPAEAQGEPVSQRDEVFELGPHRLMCGDSTSAEDWHSLLGGERGSLCFTSPPYNGNTHLSTFASRKETRGDLYRDSGNKDNMESDDYIGMCSKVLGMMIEFSDYVAWNINYNTNERSGYIYQIIPFLPYLKEQIAWIKTSVIPYASVMQRKWEPIYLFKKHGEELVFDYSTANVWNINNSGCNVSGHSACFPVELPEMAIKLFTKDGSIILEPFCGSGTTIIAAAKTGRVCRAMEIAPRYCDMIRRRWTKFAKENNVNPGTGALE
jgi:site-specific DNA-methyltransferase (adenine-specific)